MHSEMTHPLRTKNFTRVDVGPITLWWSYTDCVAFQTADAPKPYTMDPETVSSTTRRHIDSLGDTWTLSRDAFAPALLNTLTRWTKGGH